MSSSSIQTAKREAAVASGMFSRRAVSPSLVHLAGKTHTASSTLTRSSWFASHPGVHSVSWTKTTVQGAPSTDFMPFIRACSTAPKLPVPSGPRVRVNRWLVAGGGTALAGITGYAYMHFRKESSDNVNQQVAFGGGDNYSTVNGKITVNPSEQKKKPD